MNRAMKKILGAYERTHTTSIHYFCNQWRVEAMVSYRRLIAVMKWLLNGPDSVKNAIKLCVKESLIWWEATERILIHYGLLQK